MTTLLTPSHTPSMISKGTMVDDYDNAAASASAPSAPLQRKYRPLAGSLAGVLREKALAHDWGGRVAGDSEEDVGGGGGDDEKVPMDDNGPESSVGWHELFSGGDDRPIPIRPVAGPGRAPPTASSAPKSLGWHDLFSGGDDDGAPLPVPDPRRPPPPTVSPVAPPPPRKRGASVDSGMRAAVDHRAPYAAPEPSAPRAAPAAPPPPPAAAQPTALRQPHPRAVSVPVRAATAAAAPSAAAAAVGPPRRRTIFPMLRAERPAGAGLHGPPPGREDFLPLARYDSLPSSRLFAGGGGNAANPPAKATAPAPASPLSPQRPAQRFHPPPGGAAARSFSKPGHRREKSDEDLLNALLDAPAPAGIAEKAKPTRHTRQRSDEELLAALGNAPASGGRRRRGSHTTDELEGPRLDSGAAAGRGIFSAGGPGVAASAVLAGKLSPVGKSSALQQSSLPANTADTAARELFPEGQPSAPGRPQVDGAIGTASAAAPTKHPSVRPAQQNSLFRSGQRAPILPRTYYQPSNVPQYLDPKREAERSSAPAQKKPLVSILRRTRSMPVHAQVSEKSVAVIEAASAQGSSSNGGGGGGLAVDVAVPPAPPLGRLSSTISEGEQPSADVAEKLCDHNLFSPKPKQPTPQIVEAPEILTLPPPPDDGDGKNGPSMRKIHSETCLVNHQQEEVRRKSATKKQLEDDLGQVRHHLTRHGSMEDRRCKTIKFDPRIWVFEYEPHRDETSNWFTVAELERFKFEAIARIQRSRNMQQLYGGSILPSGTGRVVTTGRATAAAAAPPPPSPQQQRPSAGAPGVRALFSDPALGIDGDEDCDHMTPAAPSRRDAVARKLAQAEIRNVLIVDPHEVFLGLLARSVRAMMGHVIVTTARNAAEAQRRISAAQVVFPQSDGGATHGFDIIICEERLDAAAMRGGRRRRSKSMDHGGGGGGGGMAGGGGLLGRHRSSSVPADDEAQHQAAGDSQSQRRGPPPSGSALLGLVAAEQKEMERSWRSSSSSPSSSSSSPSWLAATMLGAPPPRPRFSLLVGVSANLAEDGERLARSGADFVWGKPPPSMDAGLRNRLLRAILEKRGKSAEAVEASG